ncbi:hypothetical protein cyc_06349 [Cyclospora cayetanensis]|uniref:Glycosyltransferase n=1 Tax=Cyclospora cayetanensis TaxID=88456 RepID=A0A1D3DAN0_9EIME|nr:hypothetical protein cyc_06349 [Cyclospora cayetanensis]
MQQQHDVVEGITALSVYIHYPFVQSPAAVSAAAAGAESKLEWLAPQAGETQRSQRAIRLNGVSQLRYVYRWVLWKVYGCLVKALAQQQQQHFRLNSLCCNSKWTQERLRDAIADEHVAADADPYSTNSTCTSPSRLFPVCYPPCLSTSQPQQAAQDSQDDWTLLPEASPALPYYHQQQERQQPRKRRIVSLGQFRAEKRHEDQLNIFKCMCTAFPLLVQRDAHLVICGSVKGQDHLRLLERCVALVRNSSSENTPDGAAGIEDASQSAASATAAILRGDTVLWPGRKGAAFLALPCAAAATPVAAASVEERISSVLCEGSPPDDWSCRVFFLINPASALVQQILWTSQVGLHCMREEHFGIAVVEQLAAGCCCVAHCSGGPASDILVARSGEKAESLSPSAARGAGCAAEVVLPVLRRAAQSLARFHTDYYAAAAIAQALQLRLRSPPS